MEEKKADNKQCPPLDPGSCPTGFPGVSLYRFLWTEMSSCRFASHCADPVRATYSLVSWPDTGDEPLGWQCSSRQVHLCARLRPLMHLRRLSRSSLGLPEDWLTSFVLDLLQRSRMRAGLVLRSPSSSFRLSGGLCPSWLLFPSKGSWYRMPWHPFP